MPRVTAGIAMSHAPGMIGWPETIGEAERRRMETACARIATYLDERRPDVLIAFLDDHFEQMYRSLTPTFAIGVADKHSGPPEYWQPVLRMDGAKDIPGSPRLAEHLLRETVHAGFDVARVGPVEYGNNLIVVMELIRKAYDIPVIPVFINVYTPPLPTMRRAYAFGQAIRAAVDAYGEDIDVGFLATGGLSHSPPIWLEHVHGGREEEFHPYLQNIKRFQHEGRAVLSEIPDLMMQMAELEQDMMRTSNEPLTNPEWDLAFLDVITSGDANRIREMSYDEIEAGGGFGAHEVLNWAALMGAMNGAPATLVDYQSVPEWITGIGYMTY